MNPLGVCHYCYHYLLFGRIKFMSILFFCSDLLPKHSSCCSVSGVSFVLWALPELLWCDRTYCPAGGPISLGCVGATGLFGSSVCVNSDPYECQDPSFSSTILHLWQDGQRVLRIPVCEATKGGSRASFLKGRSRVYLPASLAFPTRQDLLYFTLTLFSICHVSFNFSRVIELRV